MYLFCLLFTNRFDQIITHSFHSIHNNLSSTICQLGNNFLVNFDSSQVGIGTDVFIVVVKEHRNVVQRRESNGWDIFLQSKKNSI